MKKHFIAILLLLATTVTIFGAQITQNVTFTDTRTGKEYDLYEALDQGHWILLHMSWVGWGFCPGAWSPLSNAYDAFGKNDSTLLIFEVNAANQTHSQYSNWFGNKVKYGVVFNDEGGRGLDITVGNGGSGNPEYLIKPDRSFTKGSWNKSSLENLGVPKGGVSGIVTPTTFKLTVTNGTGTGQYAKDSSFTITAKDSTGYSFTKWDGNYGILSSRTAKIATVKMPDRNVAVKAVYTKTVIDTTNATPNLLTFGDFYISIDDYGTTVDTSTGFQNENRVKAKFNIVASNDAKQEYSYGGIGYDFPGSSNLEGVTYIKIKYSATKKSKLTLPQTDLLADGDSYFATLPAGTNKTVLLKVDTNTFKKPDWSNSITPLKLSEVEELSVDIDNANTAITGQITINEIRLYNYKGEITSLIKSNRIVRKCGISQVGNSIEISIGNSQLGKIEIFSSNGKLIHSTGNKSFASGVNSFNIPMNIASGLYIIRFKGNNVSLVKSISILK